MINDTSSREKIELFLRCKNLINKSFFDKSDPYVLVDSNSGGVKSDLGKTEVIRDEPNPVFQKTIFVSESDEGDQELWFTIFDEDGERDDLIGQAKCKLSEILSTTGWKELNITLPGVKQKSTLEIRWQNILFSQKNYKITVRTENISRKELFQNEEPFLRVLRPGSGFESEKDTSKIKDWVICFETQQRHGSINVRYEPLIINCAVLCRKAETDLIKVELWDHDSKGDHNFIADCYFTLQQAKSDKKVQPLMTKKQEHIGDFCIEIIEEYFDYDLKDYLKAGLQLNLMAVVDFTASNGPARSPLSLHHISQSRPADNEYQIALRKISSTLLHYDHDKKITAHGFGAKIDGEKKELFNLTLDPTSAVVGSIDELMDVYAKAVLKVELFGPTNFAPIIRAALKMTRESFSLNHWNYTILLILTDGLINDAELTRELVVECCNEAISIIIIGIGNEDFKEMKVLDGDQRALRGATRDIVQFVRFKTFSGIPDKLAKAVVSELPSQIDTFYKSKNIKAF